ncbi:MAG: fatty acyl-AMP ligase, partial [Okeania sp. SIO2D1]|nr:fatty acyl-AMP ligase [Okeania sp. SIO2D1]
MSETVKYSTLIDLLQTLSAEQPEKLAYTFLVDGKKEGDNFTYASLEHRVRSIAALLQKHEVKGERGLLLYPQGLEAIAAFCGCLYSGVIAIPVPPPEAGRLKRTLPRLRAIVQDAQASLVLTTATIISLIEEVADEFPEFETMRWIDTESVDLEIAQEWKDPGITSDTIAYLQYTSGSTSTPKGVMLNHKNLIHHLGYLQRACGYTPESKTITWMPFFHDYGLVEGM